MNTRALRSRIEQGMTQEELLQGILRVLKSTLGVRDVRYTKAGDVFVMSGPNKLRSTLRSGQLYAFLSAACRSSADRYTVQSYIENSDHWDGWESAIIYAAECLGYKGWEKLSVIPVPSSTLPFKSWSAAKRKWVPAGPKPKVSLCDAEPVSFGSASGPVLLELADGLPPLMVTHGVSRSKLREVERCGGFLWPSWALSWRVPPAYGDAVFVADSMVVPYNMRPTGRPDPKIYIAGTDIWSPTARDLARAERAMEWELSGDKRWWNGDRELEEGGWGQRGLQNDLVVQSARKELVGAWATGPGRDWSITDRITKRRALVRRMRKIFDVHAPTGDPYLYPERDAEIRITEAPYPYAEVKVVGPVRLSDVPLVVYPRRNRQLIGGVLDRCGFQGTRVEINWKGPPHGKASDEERRAFAKMVTEAILWWSADPCHRGKVGSALIRDESWRSTYQATAMWTYGARSSSNVWQPGFCGAMDPGSRRAARLSKQMRDALARIQKAGSRAGLELSDALAELEESPDYPGLLESIYGDAMAGEFRLSVEDARVANSLGWFKRKVSPGDRVTLLDWSRG